MNEAQAAAESRIQSKAKEVIDGLGWPYDDDSAEVSDMKRCFTAGIEYALSWTPIKPGVVPELPRRKVRPNISVLVPVMIDRGFPELEFSIGWYNYDENQWYEVGVWKRTVTHYFTGFIGNLPGKEGDNG